MKHTNLITASFLALSLALASCASEEPLVNPDKDILRSYEFSMFDSQNELNFSLIDINQPISRIESPFNWLDIAQGEYDEMGFTRVNITRTKPTPEGFDSDDAYLVLPDNKAVKVTITKEGMLMPPDDNSDEYDAFNKEWWNQTQILYTTTVERDGQSHTEGMQIELPWSSATTSQIPPSLYKGAGISAEGGWMMAYNLFSARPNSKPYFILYNKYTGCFRVFYYQKENAGTGGELSFVLTPDEPTSEKYPFYHSLQYAIPISNKNVPQKGNILDVLKDRYCNSVFKQQITPYLKSDPTLKTGWYCFDIDMSCYNPDARTSFDPSDRMSIDIKTANNSTVRMAGVLEGNASGTIEGLSNTSTTSGKGKNILGDIASQVKEVASCIGSLSKGDYLKGIYSGAMSAWNFTKLFDKYTDINDVKADIIPITVEQTITGKMSLEGYTTSNTSNNGIGVQFSYNAFNADPIIGQGVWSLQENPVVYVVNDLILGEDEDISVVVDNDSYLCGVEDPAFNNLRLITFFDPTSIKFNINTSVFKEIHNAEMSWICGVYPNQPQGHTDIYRNELLDFKKNGMLEEPVFIDKSHKGKKYTSFSSTFANMKYMEFPLDDMVTTSIASNTKAKFYYQNGANFRYYGHQATFNGQDDKNLLIVDPIVFLPTELIKNNQDDQYGKGVIYDFKAPDYVVGVMLKFDYSLPSGKTATACFTKRFIPVIKGITSAEMQQKINVLEAYTKSSVHQWISNIEIKHGNVTPILQGVIKNAKYIKDHQNN